MAIKVQGTTVINDNRELIVTAVKDSSNRVLVIKDAAGNIIWGS